MESTGENLKITGDVAQLVLDAEKFASRSGLWACISSGELMKGGRWTSLGWPECSCMRQLENVSLVLALMGLLAEFC